MSVFNGPDAVAALFIVIVFGGGILCALASVVGYYWQSVRVTEQNAVLKKAMIDRGFTADDIERVIAAGPDGAEKTTAESE